jgi:hypothetical protein
VRPSPIPITLVCKTKGSKRGQFEIDYHYAVDGDSLVSVFRFVSNLKSISLKQERKEGDLQLLILLLGQQGLGRRP